MITKFVDLGRKSPRTQQPSVPSEKRVLSELVCCIWLFRNCSLKKYILHSSRANEMVELLRVNVYLVVLIVAAVN